MSEAIVYVDNSEVRTGKLVQLKAAIHELADFVEANEPRILAYSAYLSQDGTHMSIVHVHPDANSLETHMKVAGPAFARFTEYVRLLSIDVYGNPPDHVLEQLREKARMLGSGTVVVHPRHAGFARFGDR